MRKISRKLFAVLGAVVVLGLVMSAPEAQARPQYLKQFGTTYPKLADAANVKKCGFCHDSSVKDKKVRLPYGKAVEAGLNKKKNEKNTDNIEKALKKAEEAKNDDGKTFGELIKDGKLPE